MTARRDSALRDRPESSLSYDVEMLLLIAEGQGWRGLPIADGHWNELPHHFFNRQSAIGNQLKRSTILVQNSERRRIQEAIRPQKVRRGMMRRWPRWMEVMRPRSSWEETCGS